MTWKDPRIPVVFLLIGYLLLGITVLGFNRSPSQILTTTLTACLFELFLMKIFRDKITFPLSATITSLGLSLLLNYGHDHLILFFPVLFAIGSKYIFTFKGKHVYNPAQIGVVLCLFFVEDLISASPAYQWNGPISMSIFIVTPALLFFMKGIQRSALVLSFLISYTLLTALRALIMKHHLPFETLFLGTLSSPSFFLFTFFMITDPATSPSPKKDQIIVGVAIAVVDLIFHLFQSYYTFFFAAFVVTSVRFLMKHFSEFRGENNGLKSYLLTRFWQSGYFKRPLMVGAVASAYLGIFFFLRHTPALGRQSDFKLQKLSAAMTGIHSDLGDVFSRVDPRIQHVIKWLFSVGASVATGDYDNDGLTDIMAISPLSKDSDRVVLYHNNGHFSFSRVPLNATLQNEFSNVTNFGIPTNAMFVDFDNDSDKDLLVTRAFGSPMLLKNMLTETGVASFVDVSKTKGLSHYTNSLAANFLDINRDGKLDLFIANVLPSDLPDYETPTKLNIFKLPQPEYEGDERMFHFMHTSWNQANNGGQNELFLQNQNASFEKQSSEQWGMPETRWSLAVATGDFNHDGFPDFYVANDFGPDDLYLNQKGTHLENFKGNLFGSIGKDTYKGMNASAGDLDRNGFLDIVVSNVHHALQAEGNLIWMFGPTQDAFHPSITDRATQLGALNQQRFGWGASLADLDNNGWLDIVQANGMVDDTIDKKFDNCPDYWYVNEKIARSPPSYHSYANKWGDIRGRCIYGKERNRVYLNAGTNAIPQFSDAAEQLGMSELTNSRGIATVDLDNDGHLDVLVTHMFEPLSVYQNTPSEGSKNPWIGMDLKGNGANCNSDAVGSTATLKYTDDKGEHISQMREVHVVNGFSAQDDMRLHFGLGKNPTNLKLTVNWCGLQTQEFDHLKIGSYQKIQQSQKI
jgi:enediyne biosynthesis protein E4